MVSERQRYAMVLAAIAVVILGVGAWFRPRPKLQSPNADTNVSVTRAELENLQQVVRRNNLKNLSASFTDVAENTIHHLTLIQPWGVNGVTVPNLGVIVPKRLDSVPRQLTFVSGTTAHLLTPGLWVPGVPFLAGHPPDDVTPARVSDSTPDQGGWVIVVANGVFGQTLVSPGIYNGISQEDCGAYIRYRLLTTVPLNKSHIGGGLFDLSGNLQGVVLSCDDTPAIIPISEVQKASAAVNSDSGRLLARFGLRLQNAAASNPGPPVVSEVWDDWPAAIAEINPGDQILKIGDQNIASRQDAVSLLLQPGTGARKLGIRHGTRTLIVTLAPASDDLLASSSTALVSDDQLGVAVARVARGSSADRTGIIPNDRILFVNGRVATEAVLERNFTPYRVPEPLQVVVQRPGRRILLAVQP